MLLIISVKDIEKELGRNKTIVTIYYLFPVQSLLLSFPQALGFVCPYFSFEKDKLYFNNFYFSSKRWHILNFQGDLYTKWKNLWTKMWEHSRAPGFGKGPEYKKYDIKYEPNSVRVYCPKSQFRLNQVKFHEVDEKFYKVEVEFYTTTTLGERWLHRYLSVMHLDAFLSGFINGLY